VKKPKTRPRDNENETAVSAMLTVWIQPRASRNEIVMMENGNHKIRLTAPPVDGAANESLIKFLSDILSVAKSGIEIVSGHTSREKVVRIKGMTEAEATRLLNSRGK
jgi:uncharacterized protein